MSQLVCRRRRRCGLHLALGGLESIVASEGPETGPNQLRQKRRRNRTRRAHWSSFAANCGRGKSSSLLPASSAPAAQIIIANRKSTITNRKGHNNDNNNMDGLAGEMSATDASRIREANRKCEHLWALICWKKAPHWANLADEF